MSEASTTASGRSSSVGARLRAAFPTFRGAIGNLGWPILLKQMRISFRKGRFFLTHFACVAALGIFVIFQLALLTSDSTVTPTQVGRSVFNAFLQVQTLIVILVFPIASATAFTEERTRESLDLLLITRLRPGEIVWGKFFAATIYCFLFLAASVPLCAVSFLYGGVQIVDVALAYAILFALTLLLSMLGLAVSSSLRSSVAATAVVYTTVISLGVFASNVLLPRSIGALFEGSVTSTVAGALIDAAGSRGREPWLVFLTHAADAAALFCALFLITVHRVQPPSADRSGGLRLLALAYIPLRGVLAILGSFHAGLLSPDFETSGKRVLDASSGCVLGLAALLFLAVLSFPTEDIHVSRRVRDRARSLRGVWSVRRLLLPGAFSGLLFTLLLAALSVFLADWVFTRGLERHATFATIYFVRESLATLPFIVAFYASVGFLLSATRFSPAYARWTLFFVFVIAFLLPLIFYLGDMEDRVYHGYFLSPCVLWSALRESALELPTKQVIGLKLGGVPNVVIARWVHGLGALLATALGVWLTRRSGGVLFGYAPAVRAKEEDAAVDRPTTPTADAGTASGE